MRRDSSITTHFEADGSESTVIHLVNADPSLVAVLTAIIKGEDIIRESECDCCCERSEKPGAGLLDTLHVDIQLGEVFGAEEFADAIQAAVNKALRKDS